MAGTIIDSITGLGDTEAVRQIVEERSGVTYVGRTRDQTASTSDAKWQVYRVVTIGNCTETEYAAQGNYRQVWDDRTNLFGPALSFTNTTSTFFDGVNDYCSAGDNLNTDNATAWSLSFWVEPNNVSAQRCIYSKVTNDSNVFGIGIYHTNTGKILVQMRASGQLRSFTTTIYGLSALTWSHVTVTYSGNQNINGLRVYVDAQVDSTPASGAITNTLLTSEPAQFGRRNTSFYFSGNMDEVSWWNKALSQSEVTELYNSGVPNNPSTTSMADNLQNHWRMGDVDAHPTIFDVVGAVNLTMFNMDSTNFELEVPA